MFLKVLNVIFCVTCCVYGSDAFCKRHGSREHDIMGNQRSALLKLKREEITRKRVHPKRGHFQKRAIVRPIPHLKGRSQVVRQAKRRSIPFLRDRTLASQTLRFFGTEIPSNAALKNFRIPEYTINVKDLSPIQRRRLQNILGHSLHRNGTITYGHSALKSSSFNEFLAVKESRVPESSGIIIEKLGYRQSS